MLASRTRGPGNNTWLSAPKILTPRQYSIKCRLLFSLVSLAYTVVHCRLFEIQTWAVNLYVHTCKQAMSPGRYSITHQASSRPAGLG